MSRVAPADDSGATKGHSVEGGEANDTATPEENADSPATSWKILLLLTFIMIVYVFLGGVIFHFIEHPNETAVRSDSMTRSKDFLQKFDCISPDQLESFVKALITAYDQGVLVTNSSSSQPNWDIPSAIFFSSTVVTTIGYGNISPATAAGQAFCAIYALVGIPINLILLAGVGSRMAKVGEKLKNLKSLKDKSKASMTVRLVVCVGIGFICMVFIPSAIFVATEGWTYGTSLYYSIITLTTVGFGDYVAGVNYSGNLRGLYRISLSVWILLGLAWVSWLLGDAQEFGTTVVTKVGSCSCCSCGKKKNMDLDGGDKGTRTSDVMMTSTPRA